MVGRPRGTLNNSGTHLTPRRNNGNIDWNKVYSEYIVDVIERQIAPNTLRGLMYILKAKDILKKSDYNGLTTHCRDWRKEGKIRWDDIIDGSGRGVINNFSDYQTTEKFVNNRVHFLRNGGQYYRQYLNTEWRWYGQSHYVEIWCEKHAIAGTVTALTGDGYVRVAYNKGNPGWRYMHDNCVRLKKEMLRSFSDSAADSRPRNVHIFYLGDWDKSGRHMDAELEGQLRYFGLWNRIHFKRIGLLPEQVEEYNLPQNFESGEGYEVDALHAFNPQAFKKLILDHINPYFDDDIHKQVLAQHPEEDIDNQIRCKIQFLPNVGSE